MITEKTVSHYNQIKTYHKISLLEVTINSRLFVSLNGVGTVHSWPAVESLNKK